MRNDDPRCCGTGTCMINADGFCWCGQRWDGEKMRLPEDLHNQADQALLAAELPAKRPTGLKD